VRPRIPKLKLEPDQDDIRAILHRSGAETDLIDRLADAATRMRALEWKMARSAASQIESDRAGKQAE
jgi:hypothetical protein